MNYKLLFLILCLAATLSCTKKNENLLKTQPTLTYEFFSENLKADMNYDAIVAKFGVPTRDEGSGIHIYIYTLIDSTEIGIGYAGKIIYARHIDKDRQILHQLF